ncbi:Uncharacterized protein FKW44_009746, partial [Caligus rogercresseyi]
IVPRGKLTVRCSGNGKYNRQSGSCECDRLYTGRRCQYKLECDSDDDCGNGKCIDIKSTGSTVKQCFCKMGYFGRYCDKSSALNSKITDLTSYQAEVEVILKVRGLSYGAVGFRKKGTSTSCRNFPLILEDGAPEGPVKFNQDLDLQSFIPKGRLHAMDCTDMVIGMARGNLNRVFDGYTRDRSRPRRDSFWGGEDDLTAALAYEEDGETTIAFRRKMKSNDKADVSIDDEDMHVIWAFGQELGKTKND